MRDSTDSFAKRLNDLKQKKLLQDSSSESSSSVLTPAPKVHVEDLQKTTDEFREKLEEIKRKKGFETPEATRTPKTPSRQVNVTKTTSFNSSKFLV